MTLRLDSSKHSIHVIAVSLIAVVASSFGPWDRSTGTLILLAIATVLIGVPHGGLDHLTGRALLKSCLPRTWPFIFFPVYLGIALVVAAGWFWLPTLTATGFFIISAWHFGLEDDRTSFSHRWADHLGAIALGGLVIWIPFLTQQSRVSSILQSILPGDFLFVVDVIGPT